MFWQQELDMITVSKVDSWIYSYYIIHEELAKKLI